MKELWTANPFCLMNRPFAEMGYNSSGLNIAPAPSVGNSPTLHAPSACFRRTILRPSARHLPTRHKPSQHTAQHLATPPQAICRRSAQHLATPCTASAISLRAILRPLRSIRRLPASHLPASSPRDTRQPIANHPPSRCAPSAGTLQAICWHEPMPLTTRRTNRRRE